MCMINNAGYCYRKMTLSDRLINICIQSYIIQAEKEVSRKHITMTCLLCKTFNNKYLLIYIYL